MSTLTEAAERYLKHYDESYAQLCDNDEWYYSSTCHNDEMDLATYAAPLLDPRLLADLTAEEMDSMCEIRLENGDWKFGKCYFSRLQRTAYIQGTVMRMVVTLGQFRHLIAAMGGST